jgi:hypothetical protein
MFWQFLIWLIPVLSAVELIYLLYLAWASSRVPKLALDDVVHFLYPVDTSLLAGLLDPAADFELRWKLSPLRLCEEQRRRMLVYRELLRRMSHNSAVLAEFDNSVLTMLWLSAPVPSCKRPLSMYAFTARLPE